MTRIELETILSKKGLNLQKVGNLYQVRSKALKTICQSHSIDEIARQILSLGGFYTQGGEYSHNTTDKACMTAFGRVTMRP